MASRRPRPSSPASRRTSCGASRLLGADGLARRERSRAVVGAWTGLAVSLAVALGFANALVMAFLEVYLSCIGTTDRYGYGGD
jgi:hypothetical protein